MDARIVEKLLEARLKRLFGKNILLTRGPFVVSKFGGIRPEVYFHVSKLEDFGGITVDGANISRRSVKGPSTLKGFAEERPGRMIVTVTCLSGSYDILQEVLKTISPSVLLALEQVPGFSLGPSQSDAVQLRFDDFQACLASAELNSETTEKFSYFRGTLIFHLNGYIHVRVTARGGLARKPKVDTIPKKPKPSRPRTTPKKRS